MKAQTEQYYASARSDLISFVPPEAQRVLEVGCGTGATGRALKDSRSTLVEVVGIEVNEKMAEQAKSHMDQVLIGDVEKMDLAYKQGYFDCIIYGDVLEHLVDPWTTLCRHCEFLSSSGVVIASIPNIAHYRTIQMLKKHKWEYQDAGIMDRTHLRFFTIDSIKDLFSNANLKIEHIDHKLAGSKIKKFFNKVSGGAMVDSLTEQYVVVASKHE